MEARLARDRDAEDIALIYNQLVSRIFPENAASLTLHERLGFRTVGVYRRHGKLDGEWRDCVIVEKIL
jgi:phosphinothricin acetyltransferase